MLSACYVIVKSLINGKQKQPPFLRKTVTENLLNDYFKALPLFSFLYLVQLANTSILYRTKNTTTKQMIESAKVRLLYLIHTVLVSAAKTKFKNNDFLFFLNKAPPTFLTKYRECKIFAT